MRLGWFEAAAENAVLGERERVNSLGKGEIRARRKQKTKENRSIVSIIHFSESFSLLKETKCFHYY